MIPKVIHYCWFGYNPKSELIEKCIASWHKYCPDYEIIEWNESNYDISKSDFMQEAYDAKKWAFVSDYARLDIVAQNGGIYLDTDVELYESFDDLLEMGAFFSFESARNINSGQCFGAEKRHRSVLACLQPYLNKHFIINGKPDLTPSPRITTQSLIEAYPSIIRNGQKQVVGDIMIFGCAYQHRFKHYGMATWTEGYKQQYTCKDGKIRSKLRNKLRNPKIFDWIEAYLGEKVLGVYTVLAYDLIDMGPIYFIKRKVKK